MLLEKSDKPFHDPAFLFEPKIDSHRFINEGLLSLRKALLWHHTNRVTQYLA
jgi:hypothetical protein